MATQWLLRGEYLTWSRTEKSLFFSVLFFTNLSKILAIQLLLAPIIVYKKGRIRRKISLKLQWPMGNATPCLRLTKLRFQVLSHIKMSTQLSFSPVAKMQKRECILKRLQMDSFETILAFLSLPFFHKSQVLRVFCADNEINLSKQCSFPNILEFTIKYKL